MIRIRAVSMLYFHFFFKFMMHHNLNCSCDSEHYTDLNDAAVFLSERLNMRFEEGQTARHV